MFNAGHIEIVSCCSSLGSGVTRVLVVVNLGPEPARKPPFLLADSMTFVGPQPADEDEDADEAAEAAVEVAGGDVADDDDAGEDMSADFELKQSLPWLF